MKKMFTVVCLLLAMSPVFAYSESFCERVNGGRFNEYPQLAKSMNKLTDAKGAHYKTSAKEMRNVMTSYCKKNPYASGEDAQNFLTMMAETLAAAERMK